MQDAWQRFLDGWHALEGWQRGVLVGLTSVVVVLTAVVVFVGNGDDGSDDIASPTTEPTTTASSTTTTTTTTAPTTTTTTSSTTTSTTTTTTTTTTTAPPESLLTLRPDGLGAVFFGDDADEALLALVDLLGTPDDDTGWTAQVETCIGTEIRFVSWGSLRVFFTNGPSEWAPVDVRHFASYDHAGAIGSPVLELYTAEGVGIGSAVGDVRAIYGDDAVITGDPLFGDLFQVRTSGAGFLWGQLTGPQPTDTVASISGGYSCGE